MKITCNVDQTRALREGVDAPHSTCRIEVDPAELTTTERELLSALLESGHDTTKRGIRRPQPGVPTVIAGQSPISSDEIVCERGGQPLKVITADLPGLRRGIAELLTWHADALAEAAEKTAEADARIDEAIAAERSTRTQLVALRDGKIVDAYVAGPAVIEIDLPVEPSVNGGAYHRSPEAAERLAVARAETREKAARLREAARPELEQLAAAEAEHKAAELAEYEALKARVEPALLARCEAGFGRPHELQRAMRAIALADACQEVDPWTVDLNANSQKLTELTEAEFAALQAAREAAPSGATVEPMLIWTSEYRDATEQELADGLGDEDDEIEERQGERRVLLVKWMIGGDRLEVTAVAPLPCGQPCVYSSNGCRHPYPCPAAPQEVRCERAIWRQREASAR